MPTLEEAMTLIEPEQEHGDLSIDPVFDSKQRWIWTTDQMKGESRVWVVDFTKGGRFTPHTFDGKYLGYVRAVRSGQSSTE